MPERRKRAEQSEETRERLLDAGLAVLAEQPTDKLFERLQARPIADRAGLTTGAFYYHFDGPDEFVEALLHLSLDREPNPELGLAASALASVATEGGSFVEAFVAAAVEALAFNRTDPTFKLMLSVAAKAGHDREIRARLRRMYGRVEAAFADYCNAVMEVLGAEMRPPFNVDDLANAFLAVFEGLGLRQAVDPEAVPPDRLGMLLLPIIVLMVRPRGTSEDTNTWLSANAPKWAVGTPFATPAAIGRPCPERCRNGT